MNYNSVPATRLPLGSREHFRVVRVSSRGVVFVRSLGSCHVLLGILCIVVPLRQVRRLAAASPTRHTRFAMDTYMCDMWETWSATFMCMLKVLVCLAHACCMAGACARHCELPACRLQPV